MAEAILDLEAAIQDWSTDTDENDNADRARAVLRGLVTRLGRAAPQGLADPAAELRPSIEPLLKLREDLRQSGSYGHADLIRDALAAAGIEVRDTPDGSHWTVSAER
jgi:cysteinyl-tRNA synthetase